MDYGNLKGMAKDIFGGISVLIFFYYALVVGHYIGIQADYPYLGKYITEASKFLYAYKDLSLYLITVCIFVGVEIDNLAFEIGYKKVENYTIVDWQVFGSRLMRIASYLLAIELPIFMKDLFVNKSRIYISLIYYFFIYLLIVIGIKNLISKIRGKTNEF